MIPSNKMEMESIFLPVWIYHHAVEHCDLKHISKKNPWCEIPTFRNFQYSIDDIEEMKTKYYFIQCFFRFISLLFVSLFVVSSEARPADDKSHE